MLFNLFIFLRFLESLYVLYPRTWSTYDSVWRLSCFGSNTSSSDMQAWLGYTVTGPPVPNLQMSDVHDSKCHRGLIVSDLIHLPPEISQLLISHGHAGIKHLEAAAILRSKSVRKSTHPRHPSANHALPAKKLSHGATVGNAERKKSAELCWGAGFSKCRVLGFQNESNVSHLSMILWKMHDSCWVVVGKCLYKMAHRKKGDVVQSNSQ